MTGNAGLAVGLEMAFAGIVLLVLLIAVALLAPEPASWPEPRVRREPDRWWDFAKVHYAGKAS